MCMVGYAQIHKKEKKKGRIAVEACSKRFKLHDGLDYKERKRRERNKSGSSKIFLDGRYA